MLPPHPELKQAVGWVPNDPISEFDQHYRIERLGNGIMLPNIQSCTEFPISIQSWRVIDTTKLSGYEVHARMGYPVEVHPQRGLTYDPIAHHQWPLANFGVYPDVFRATKVMDSEGQVFNLENDDHNHAVKEVQHRVNQNYIFYHYLPIQQVIVPVVIIGNTIDEDEGEAYFEFVQQHDYVRFAGTLSLALGKILSPEHFNRRRPNPYKGCTAEAMTELTRTMGRNHNIETWDRMKRSTYTPSPVDQYIKINVNPGDAYGICSIKPTPCTEFKDSPLGVFFKARNEAELEEKISESPSILDLELRKILPELTSLSRKEREIKTKGYITDNPYFKKLYEAVRDHLAWHETMNGDAAVTTSTQSQEKELPVFSNNSTPRLTDEQRFRVFEAGRLNQVQATITVVEQGMQYTGNFVPYQQPPVDQNGVKYCQGSFFINGAAHEYILACAAYVDALINAGYHHQLFPSGHHNVQHQVLFNRQQQQQPVDNGGLSEADMIAIWGYSGESTKPTPAPTPAPIVSRVVAQAPAPIAMPVATPFDDMNNYTPDMEVVANDLSKATEDLRSYLLENSSEVMNGVPIYNLVKEPYEKLTILQFGNALWAAKVNRLVRAQVPDLGPRVLVVSHDNLAVVLPKLDTPEQVVNLVLPWCGLIMMNRKKAFYEKLRATTPKPVLSEQDRLLDSFFGFVDQTPQVNNAPAPAPVPTPAPVPAPQAAVPVAAPERRRSLLTTASDTAPAPAPTPIPATTPVEVELEEPVDEPEVDMAIPIDFGPNAVLVQSIGSVYAFGGYQVDLDAYIKAMLKVEWVKSEDKAKGILYGIIQNLKSGRFDLLPVGAEFPVEVTEACLASGVQKVDFAPWCYARQTPVATLDPNEVHTVKAYFLYLRDLIKLANKGSSATGAPALLGMAKVEFEKLKKTKSAEEVVEKKVEIDQAALEAKMIEATEKLNRSTFVFGEGIEPVLRTPEHPLTVRRLAAATMNLHPVAVAFANLKEMPDTPTAKKWAEAIRKARSVIRETGTQGSRVIETYDDVNTVVTSPWVDEIGEVEWIANIKEEYIALFNDVGWNTSSFNQFLVDSIAMGRVMDLDEIREEMAERVKAIVSNKDQFIAMATEIDDLKSRTTRHAYNLRGVAGCIACVPRELQRANAHRESNSVIKVLNTGDTFDEEVLREPLVQITLHFDKENDFDTTLAGADKENTDLIKLSVVENLDDWMVEAFPQPEMSYVSPLGVTVSADDMANDDSIDVLDNLTPVKTFIPTVYVNVSNTSPPQDPLAKDGDVNVECVVEYRAFDDGGYLSNYIKDYKERVAKSEFGLLSEYIGQLRADLAACIGDSRTERIERSWTYVDVCRFGRLITTTINEHLRVALGLAVFIPDVMTCELSTFENIDDGVLSFDISGAGLMIDFLENILKRENDGEHFDEPTGSSITAETYFYVNTTRLANNIGVRNVGREGKLINPDECGEFINTLIKALAFVFAGMTTTPPVKLFTGCTTTYTLRHHDNRWMIAMG